MHDMLERAGALRAQGEAFAVATVVSTRRPTAAKPGMKAIILPDGTVEGWVGGSCAQPIVAREALAAMRDGAPRLIRLSPEPDPRREGVIHHTMTCHGGGSLEIFIEPVLPKPQLLLVGEDPLVDSLATLGRLAGFAVWIIGGATVDQGRAQADLLLTLEEARARITPHCFVVVATAGACDEEALEQVAPGPAAYVALVASRKRAESVFAALRERGVRAEHLGRIKVPAGLDIGAVTPEEIAVSIMAEIIQVRRVRPSAPAGAAAAGAVAAAPANYAVDPVCGMTVQVSAAGYTSDYDGVRFYFCCARCREAFQREPAKYAVAKA